MEGSITIFPADEEKLETVPNELSDALDGS